MYCSSLFLTQSQWLVLFLIIVPQKHKEQHIKLKMFVTALNGHCRNVCTAGTFHGSYRTSPSFACSHWVGVWWVMGIFSVLNTFSLSCWFSHLHTVANHFAREKWGKGVFKNLSAIQQNTTAEAWCCSLSLADGSFDGVVMYQSKPVGLLPVICKPRRLHTSNHPPPLSLLPPDAA